MAIADRGSNAQVLLRQRFAGPHTVDVAISKVSTPITCKQNTLSLGQASRRDGSAAPIRHFPRVVVMGGIPIEATGSPLGAIAVSGRLADWAEM